MAIQNFHSYFQPTIINDCGTYVITEIAILAVKTL